MKKSCFLIIFLVIVIFFQNNITYSEGIYDEKQGWIAYVDGTYNVWLMRPDGSEKKKITKDGENTAVNKIFYLNIKWSRDGKKLGFIRIDKKLDLVNFYVYSVFDESIEKFDLDIGRTFDWYIDSEHIIYQVKPKPILEERINGFGEFFCEIGFEEDDGLRIFSIRTKEDEPFFNYDKEYPIQKPNLSPDGNYLIFESLMPNHYSNISNQNLVKLSEPEIVYHFEDVFADCSWNKFSDMAICGSWFLSKNIYSSEEDIYIQPLQVISISGELIDIGIENDEFERNPMFDPSGSFLFYNTSELAIGYHGDGPCGGGSIPSDPKLVKRLNLISGEIDLIGEGALFDISPDGQSLLVVDQYRCYGSCNVSIIDTETKEVFLITRNGYEAAWQPK